MGKRNLTKQIPILGVPLILSLVGCGEESLPIRGPVRPWDSVTVERYITSAGEAEDVQRSVQWALSPEPTLELGANHGGDSHLFGLVRGGVMLPDGGIVVADVHESALVYFDERGGLRTVAGGPGEGPGEFELLFWLGECAPDSIYAYDAGLGRASVFSTQGEFERSFPLVAPGGVPVDPPRCSTEGLLVAKGFPTWEDAPEVGRWVPEIPIFILDGGGKADSIIAAFPYRDYIGRGSEPISSPLASEAFVEVFRERLFLAYSDRYEIGVFSLDGTPSAVFGLDLPLRPVSSEDSEAYVEENVEGLEGPVAQRWGSFLTEHIPEHFPFFDRVLAVSNGDIWVRRYPSSIDENHWWDVFSGTGGFPYIGSIQVPRAFDIFQVRDGLVAGQWVGEFDEDRIRVYRLQYMEEANSR